MRTNTRLLTYIAFALSIAFVSICSAVGFGETKVYSYLDEPLVAELEVLGLNDLHPNQLTVNLADASDFTRAGVARPFVLSDLSFEVFSYKDKVLIRISSSTIIKDPSLEFLLVLTWPDGSLVKNCIFLIDPPPINLNSKTRTIPLSDLAIKEQIDISEAIKTNEIPKQDRKNVQNKFSDDSIKQDNNVTTQSSQPSSSQNESQAAGSETEPELVPSVVPDVSVEEPTITEATPVVVPPAADSPKHQTDLGRIAAERNKRLDMFKEPGEGLEEKIDFGDVIKQSTETKTDTGVPVNSVAIPAVTTPAPIATPTVEPPPETAPQPEAIPVHKEKSVGIPYLLLTLVVALGVVFAIIIKKGIYRKFLPKKASPNDVDLKQYAEKNNSKIEEDFDVDIDLDDNNMNEKFSEDLNLNSMANDIKDSKVDMDKFEEQLRKLDLDKLAEKELEPETKAQFKTVSDLLKDSPVEAPHLVENIKPQEDEIMLAMPVAEPTTETSGGLKLAPEGASMLDADALSQVEIDAINLKLKLAKQYLDADDPESAKHLLQELIGVAKGNQLAEAQKLLQGID